MSLLATGVRAWCKERVVIDGPTGEIAGISVESWKKGIRCNARLLHTSREGCTAATCALLPAAASPTRTAGKTGQDETRFIYRRTMVTNTPGLMHHPSTTHMIQSFPMLSWIVRHTQHTMRGPYALEILLSGEGVGLAGFGSRRKPYQNHPLFCFFSPSSRPA